MIMFHTRKGWVNMIFIRFIFEHTQEILAHDDLRVLGEKKIDFSKNKCYTINVTGAD